MPAEGVALSAEGELLRREEVVRLATAFVRAGVRKIRLTGGEPLVRGDAVEIVRDLGALKGAAGLESLTMTTNGLVLSRHLESLLAAGLTGVNISLDTLQEARFAKIARRPGGGMRVVQRAVRDALGLATQLPDGVKLNCVVMRGVNDDEIGAFADLARAEPLHVRFIEYMPFSGNAWSGAELFSAADIRARLRDALGVASLQDVALPLAGNETAVTYRPHGFRGTLGVIASMTEPFCAGCDRLRLTANGQLRTCLFGAHETDLRTPLRAGASDHDLMRLVVAPAIAAKDRQLGGHASPDELARSGSGRPMITIGG